MFKDNLTTAVATPPHRRWRFWLLLFGIPILALVLSGVVWMFRANAGLQAAIDEADRLDPRWRLEEIEADRATPPQGQNAADTIAAIRLLIPRGWPGADMIPIFNDLPPENQLNAEQIAALKDRLAQVGPALVEARSLINTPRGRHPATYSPDWISTDLEVIQRCRGVAVLLQFDIYARSQAGDADGALSSCLAIFNAGTSIGDEPNLIAQIVRTSVQGVAIGNLERTLAQGEPTEVALAAFQARLETAEPDPLWLHALRGERAGIYLLFENLRNGNVALDHLKGGPFTFDDVLDRLPGRLAVQQAALLRGMNEMVETAKRMPEQWTELLNAQEAELNDLPGSAQSLLATHAWCAVTFRSNHALLRCAIVAIAAERYRKAKGQWPATPDDLVKAALLKSVPTDPYAAGQLIKFAQSGDGLIVYTTGADGKDDGGKLDKDARKAGADFGLRLWGVAARRQPALPPKP
jgi:hypothetical protein